MLILESFSAAPAAADSVCCVGTFDGIHLGHQQLIRAAVNEARARAVRCALITFFPHPRVLLGGAPSRYLTPPDEKATLIAALGVDVLLVHPFDRETMQTSANDFVERMLNAFGMRSLWLGPDFALGHRRQGNAEYLAARGRERGFDVHVLPQISLGDRAISSSRIREAIARGDMRDAALCLGRPYVISGVARDERTLCAGDYSWMPAPGRYAAAVNDAVRAVDVVGGCELRVDDPVLAPGAAVRVEFV